MIYLRKGMEVFGSRRHNAALFGRREYVSGLAEWSVIWEAKESE